MTGSNDFLVLPDNDGNSLPDVFQPKEFTDYNYLDISNDSNADLDSFLDVKQDYELLEYTVATNDIAVKLDYNNALMYKTFTTLSIGVTIMCISFVMSIISLVHRGN